MYLSFRILVCKDPQWDNEKQTQKDLISKLTRENEALKQTISQLNAELASTKTPQISEEINISPIHKVESERPDISVIEGKL